MKSEMELECYNEPGPKTLQRIERVKLEAARLMEKAGEGVKISTGKIDKKVMEFLREHGLVEKVQEHDEAIKGIRGTLKKVFGFGKSQFED